ncbi:MAG TPA: tetratricopeptide repeat protein [Planctomycetota bacterium]|nr:tetratricopeptide repeat protein [Planctomycetota bacterium]
MRAPRNLLLAAVALIAVFSRAADAQLREKWAKLDKEIHSAFAAKNYDTAIEKCKEQLALQPNNANANYNLACAFSRLGKTDDAFKCLEKAVEAGFTDVAHIKADEDLKALQADKRFNELLATAEKKERDAPFEKGAEIAGLRTIDDFPEGGLRYRVRLGQSATKDKPHRLIVWLHPSGGSMNNVIESMSAKFADKGYALLVTTRKQWMGWNSDDAEKLISKTLPHAAKIEGLDAAKPILMGYSAGGQLALQLWDRDPSLFGGMVLDAAYPLDMQKYQQRQTVPQELPKNEAYKNVPIFAICGGDDGGTALWKQVEEPWKKAGVPLTFKVVPGKGHTWLFGQAETEELLKWLEEVKQPKK